MAISQSTSHPVPHLQRNMPYSGAAWGYSVNMTPARHVTGCDVKACCACGGNFLHSNSNPDRQLQQPSILCTQPEMPLSCGCSLVEQRLAEQPTCCRSKRSSRSNFKEVASWLHSSSTVMTSGAGFGILCQRVAQLSLPQGHLQMQALALCK